MRLKEDLYKPSKLHNCILWIFTKLTKHKAKKQNFNDGIKYEKPFDLDMYISKYQQAQPYSTIEKLYYELSTYMQRSSNLP
jgi:hypothetical protein